ncbi:MAG: site-specific integrase [Alphaproteobacteria bacterium]|nr:site-specific integrase [Alphaproteobacteria bacterium]
MAEYLAAHAGLLSCATLTRRLAAISKAHTMQGYPSPATNDLIRMTMRGIRRTHGKPQEQVSPLCRDDLLLVLSYTPDDLRGARDKALLLLGFCGALRRSELCRVRHEDLAFTSEGLVLTLPRSKTDQTGEGRKIGVPFGRGKICPVRILQDWLVRSGITSGYIFRGIDKGIVTEMHLCDRSMANIIKARVGKVGLSPEKFSGHSLRSGLATSAAMAGISSFKIREQTGHKSDAMLARYIRNGSLFHGNAAAIL